MPAPEQSPMVEEGLPQTAQEASTGPGMEPETTATTILASVKEQVSASFSAIQQLRVCVQLTLSLTALLQQPSLFLWHVTQGHCSLSVYQF